ncbi:MAG: hypothetical protein Q4G60_02540 [bacterium]|nr:hypothetical protein [bacterium]
MNIGVLLIAIVGGIVGLFSTLYLVVGFPAVLIWKVYRKARFGISLIN